jgi:ABC-type phosphonate transport system ATPase subunit
MLFGKTGLGWLKIAESDNKRLEDEPECLSNGETRRLDEMILARAGVDSNTKVLPL